MSTRSLIGRENADGSVRYVYCHFDGYPTGVGATLLAHYAEPAKLDQLLDLGDLSSLGEEIGEQHPFDRSSLPTEQRDRFRNWTTAYARDRGDADCAAAVAEDVAAAFGAVSWAQFFYLFRVDGVWVVKDRGGEVRLLADVLAGRART